MSEQDQQNQSPPPPQEDDKKRKLDEMQKDDGGDADSVVEKSSEGEEAAKNKKLKTTESTAEDPAAASGSFTSSTPAPPQVATLKPGQIYRIQSFHLGNFHFRAGDMPLFQVNGAPVTIWDESGNVVFSAGTTRDRVELKENVDRWFFTARAISVTLIPGGNPRPQILLKGDSISIHPGSSAATKLVAQSSVVVDGDASSEDPSLQIVGIAKEPVIINGKISAVVKGSGGVLTFNGTGEVTVQGSLTGLRNNGSGDLKVKGDVKGEVSQTGSGTVQIDGDVHGDIVNSGGGSITVAGKHLGEGSKVRNVPGGGGKVSIVGGGIIRSTWKWIWGL